MKAIIITSNIAKMDNMDNNNNYNNNNYYYY